MTAGRESTLFVRVDAAKCCGYRICAQVCPEVFKLDDQGFAYVEQAALPVELEPRVREAAAACPEDAILLGQEPF
jgi:ferredoxin